MARKTNAGAKEFPKIARRKMLEKLSVRQNVDKMYVEIEGRRVREVFQVLECTQ